MENGDRHFDFLRSAVETANELDRHFLSQTVIKALNFHAVVCLHSEAGAYRPCQVTVGEYVPPPHYQVPALMDNFVNEVNRHWEASDPLTLAAFTLWKLNHIHPFINGNGRTARAACYFVLCLKLGGWLPGTPILPQLLKQNRDRLVEGLRATDASIGNGQLDLQMLVDLISELLGEQIPEEG